MIIIAKGDEEQLEISSRFSESHWSNETKNLMWVALLLEQRPRDPSASISLRKKKEEKEQRSVVVVKVQQKLCTKYERHGLCIFAPHPCKILNNTTEMPSQWGWWWCFHKFTWSAPLVHRSFQARKVSHLNHGRWAAHGSTLTIHALFSRVFLSTSCQGQMKTMFSRKRMMTLFSIVVAM
jgi:hypothetical protein